ncbi:MmyB-like transcription regulator ligand binding domain-containing protein OS=Streptomyces gougerotii OX=53448 GN=GCM10010227_06500 PE=4 SV=1 [Streptomyces diastaticus subsp. diastaticus]
MPSQRAAPSRTPARPPRDASGPALGTEVPWQDVHRATCTRPGSRRDRGGTAPAVRAGGRAEELRDLLLDRSEEFASLWSAHGIDVLRVDPKRLRHPELGVLTLQCQVLLDPEQNQTLLAYTAAPGSADDEKLRLLPVLGARPVGT